MRTKHTVAFLIIAAAAVSFPAAQNVVEEIVAVVNDEIITLSDYREQYEVTLAMMRTQLRGEEFEKQRRQLKDELLDMMITDLLLIQKAKEEGFNVAEQLKMTIQTIKEENNMATDEDLRRALQQQGIGFNAWIAELEESLLKQAVIFTEVDRAIVLDDSEIVRYYRQHPEEFTIPDEFKLRAVFISLDEADAEKLETRKRTIDASIDAGDSLAAVAKEHSDPPLDEVEGDLGRFRKGDLDPDLEAVVETIQIGEISPWVKTRSGWYRLQLEERIPSHLRPFEEARKDVEERLFLEKRQNKMEGFMKELRKKSYIKILNPDPLNL